MTLPLAENLPPLSANNLKSMRALHLKKYRDAEGAFIAEGARLCEEALASQTGVRRAVVTDDAVQNRRIAGIVAQCVQRDIPVLRATARQFAALSEEKSPQGVAFVVDKPRPSQPIGQGRLLLALDRLQDPGNLGAILRSADWFGLSQVLLSRGSVDVYNSKVVRSSMGAVFRLDVFEQLDLARILKEQQSRGRRIIGAVASAETALAETEALEKDILVVGSEAEGISGPVLELLDVAVAIPGAGRGESLNAAAAAAICLYHLTRETLLPPRRQDSK